MSSLLEQASLIVTPNAFKAGKLYSIKPTSGAGDLDVVRATSATRVNSAGLIESVANNIPRLDYTNGSCPSILVEPQRTNLVINSNLANNNTGFTKITGQPSPDGLNNASLLTEVSLNNQKIVTSTTATILGNNTYAYSVFLKFNGIQNITINASDGVSGFTKVFDILNGVIIGSSTDAFIIPYSNGWYRCVVIRTSGASATNGFVQINLGTYSGDGVKGFFWFGVQLEAGSNATSYIPTVATTVTRNADVISKTGISDLIGQTEGVLFFDGVVNNIQSPSSNILNTNKNPSVASQIALIKTKSTNKFSFFQFLGDGTFNNIRLNSTNSFIDRTRTKIAIRYKSGDFAMYINGNLEATSLSTFINIGIKSELFLNDLVTVYAHNENVSFNSVILFKEILNNSELQQLTTL
jgi:hypothetical protein